MFMVNATLGTRRRAATPTNGSYGMVDNLSNIPAHVESATEGEQFTQGDRALKVDYIVGVDFDPASPLDLRVDDQFTGYNPFNLDPAPLLRVAKINLIFGGPLAHLECWCMDIRST